MAYNNNNNGRPGVGYPRTQNGPYNGNGNGNQPPWRGGSKFEQRDVSTAGITLSNPKMGKFLQLRLWKRVLGLSIGTFAPNTVLDADQARNAQVLSHYISYTDIVDLLEICERVKESLQKGESFSPMAVRVGKKQDAMLEITNGSNINMPEGLYLVIYKLDEMGRSNTYDLYPFASSTIMKDYNHTSGDYTEETVALADFKKFMIALREAGNAFTMSQAHATADLGKFTTVNEGMIKIVQALGLKMEPSQNIARKQQYNNNGGGGYNRNGGGRGNYGGNRYNNNGGQQRQFTRQSQGGQWNRNGQYGQQAQQNAPQNISSEPVEMPMSADTLQTVGMDAFS